MVRIKEITWKKITSTFGDTYHHEALVREHQLLWVMEDKKYPLHVDTSKLPFLVSRYYIHTLSSIFRIQGNEGIKEWGWFDDAEECKSKAEEIITQEILSFIDMRDHKIDEVLK